MQHYLLKSTMEAIDIYVYVFVSAMVCQSNTSFSVCVRRVLELDCVDLCNSMGWQDVQSGQ